MQADYHQVSQKRLDIQRNRIDACETLIDHILDDLPHIEQQPLLDLLLKKQAALEDEMNDALTP